MYIVYCIFESNETASIHRNLETDDFCIIQNDNYLNIQDMPNSDLEQDTLSKLPEGYQFMDYVYIIKNNALSISVIFSKRRCNKKKWIFFKVKFIILQNESKLKAQDKDNVNL